MNSEATLKSAFHKSPAVRMPAPLRWDFMRTLALRAGVTAAIAALVAAGLSVRFGEIYRSGSGFGYALGLAGGLLMLGLLLYPMRKRFRFMHEWGALKHWFRFHMLGGILGPVLVLFHSTFKVGSFNAAVALACMLLVVASGLVGRFIYRRIHHGLYGAHATLKELEQSLAQQFEALDAVLRGMPGVKQEVERFTALVSHLPENRAARAAHFLSLGLKRVLVKRSVRRALAAYTVAGAPCAATSHKDLANLLRTIDDTLQAMQRRAQFSTYERLFSLWHVIHIPFLCMLVVTAVVHVVAVHIY